MTVNINRLFTSQVRKLRRYHTRKHNLGLLVEQARKNVVDIEAQRNRLKYPHWIDHILKPIAKELAKTLDMDYDILGPFGLNCETAIHLYPKNRDKSKRGLPKGTRSIDFRPVDDHVWDADSKCITKGFDLRVVDYRVNTRKYTEGSIPEMNGDNFKTAPMPRTIKGLIRWMELQEKGPTKR